MPDIMPNPPSIAPKFEDVAPKRPYRDLWVQHAMPLIYDDSLSYYEVLAKLRDYVNRLLEDVKTLDQNVDNLHEDFLNLQQFVNQEFNRFESEMNRQWVDFQVQMRNDFEKYKQETTEYLNNKFEEFKTNLTNYVNEFLDRIENEIHQYLQNLETQLRQEITNWENQFKQEINEWKQQTLNDIQTWENNFKQEIDQWKEETYNHFSELIKDLRTIINDLSTRVTKIEGDITNIKNQITNINNQIGDGPYKFYQRTINAAGNNLDGVNYYTSIAFDILAYPNKEENSADSIGTMTVTKDSSSPYVSGVNWFQRFKVSNMAELNELVNFLKKYYRGTAPNTLRVNLMPRTSYVSADGDPANGQPTSQTQIISTCYINLSDGQGIVYYWNNGKVGVTSNQTQLAAFGLSYESSPINYARSGHTWEP